MVIYKDVVIEREYCNISFDPEKQYKVLLNFDFSDVIGFCKVRLAGKELMADFYLKTSCDGLTPSIGFMKNKLFGVGLSSFKNEDESIKPLYHG